MLTQTLSALLFHESLDLFHLPVCKHIDHGLGRQTKSVDKCIQIASLVLYIPDEFRFELLIEQLGRIVPGKGIEIHVFPEFGRTVGNTDNKGGGRQKVFDIARGQTDALAE